MAARSVIVRLEAQVGGYVSGLGKAATETENLAKKAAQARNSVRDNHQAMEDAGKVMMGFGAITVAGLGAATKAAMDWETAWAGVTKTVDGTPEQMDALEESLRGLAKTLPATHTEIAGIAEAAGQLGVAREDVVGFTKTMIDLSETTNLTADEAATSIAQISNVMGTMEREGSEGVARFGAALVALGNDGASTEAEIVGMASRLSGAMKLVGASESDLLAMANAMASVGIEAQLGGGVMSRVMQRMYADVMEGGEGLQNLADVSGVSAQEFATAFENDPVRATDMMIKGLNGVKESGGNVIETMSDLGIKGTEETSVILRLAGAGDLLTDSLDLGAEAWENNTALLDEAAKRYETTDAKVQIAWNNIKDAAIDAGAVMLPVIQGAAEAVSGLAQTFGALPEPVQGVVTVFAAVVGGAALLGGAALTLIPKIAETREAFRTLNDSGSKIPGTFGKIAKGAAAAGAIAAVGLSIAKIAESTYLDDLKEGTGHIAEGLAEIAANGPGAETALDDVFKDLDGGEIVAGVDDLDSAIARLYSQDPGDKFNFWAQGVIGSVTPLKGSLGILEDQFAGMDAELAGLVTSGNLDQADAGFQQIMQSFKDQGIGAEEAAKRFPQYADALAAAAAEQKTAATTGADAKETIEDVGNAAEQSAEQADELVESLLAINGVNISAADAQLGFDQAIADAAENAGNAGAGIDYLNEKTGEFNQTAADNLELLNGIASKGNSNAEAVYEQTGSYEDFQKSLKSSRESLFEVAKGYFDTEEAAWAYVDSVMAIPPEMKTVVNITDNNSIQGVMDNLTLLHESIQNTPNKTVIVDEPMSPEIRAGLEELGYVITDLPDGTIQVGEEGTDATGKKIDNTAGKERLATIDSTAITDAAENALNHTARDRSSTVFQTTQIGVQYTYPEDMPYPSRIPKNSTGQSSIFPRRATGGDLDMAPGPKGVDSQLFIGAKGEHVLTAQEVDLMGGQQAVYRFRDQLRSGRVGSHANGGEIGSMYAPAQQIAAAGSSGTRIDLGGIVIQGATDANAVRRAVMDEIEWKFQKNGVRLGG